MSKVVRTDKDALNAVLSITIPKEDYLSKVQKEIKKYTQKASMKGFRPGKTPQTLVKKMYGSQFLMDSVNDIVRTELGEYLNEEKANFIGEPLPSAEQPKFQLDLKDPQDLVFKFDIGLLPQFEIKALDGTTYNRYAVQIADDVIDAELEKARTNTGEEKEVTDNIQDNDLLNLKIKEVGGTLEKDLMLSMNWLTDDMKSVFETQKQGDSLQINIFQLEKETTPQYVRKYFLGLDDKDDREVNETFDATIVSVKRKQAAALDADFYTKAFGLDVTNETEARAVIASAISKNYDAQADALLLRDLQDRLLAENESSITFPDAYMKRWLKSQNPKNSDEIIDREYPFLQNNLRWTLIRNKVMDQAGIKVTGEEMRAHYANQIKGYLGGMAIGEEFITSLVDKVMNDEKQFNNLYEDVLTNKVFDEMKNRITIVDKPVTADELATIIAAAQAEVARQRGDKVENTVEEAIEA
jgi:trigger factor